MSRALDPLAIVALALLSAIFLKVVPGGLPPYGGDVLVHVYPLLSLLASGLHAARPVLWNFYAAGGYPLAPYSALSLYPPVAAALLALPVTSAIAALYVAYLTVLGAGTYLLCGDLGLSRAARLCSAVTLAYGGFVAAHVYAGHIFELGAICPLPLAFLMLRRAITRARCSDAVWCGAIVGLMVMAAGVQFLPFALAPLPALALWHAGARAWSGPRRAGRITWPLAALAIAAVISAALSAIFLLPFREILGGTLRAAVVPYDVATMQSLPWGGLSMFVAPDALGNAAAGTYWPADRKGAYFHEIYAYAGLLPLLLAPGALLRHRQARPYGLLALAALLVMLGANTPLYRLIYDLHLPGSDLLRAPARAGLVVDFALAIVAGFGLDTLRGVWRDSSAFGATARYLAPGLVVPVAAMLTLAAVAQGGLAVPPAGRTLAAHAAVRLGVSLVVGCAALAGLMRDGRLALLVPALAMLDLYSANSVLFRPIDPAAYYRQLPAMSAVVSDSSGRFWSRDAAIPLGQSMVTRAGYDVQDPAPLALEEYWRLSHPGEVARANGGVVVTGRDRILDVEPFFLRLFGVHTVTSVTPIARPDLRLVGRITSRRWLLPGGTQWNAPWVRATSLVYHDAAALPRLVVAPHAVTVGGAVSSLTATQAISGDLRRRVVLDRQAPALPVGLLADVQARWADWLAGTPENTITTVADGGAGGGYLVVDDGWFPGWTATVDGRPTAVRRADYLLRAIALPPGRHRVRMVYAPLTYLAGASVTLLTALALLLLAIVTIVRRLRTRTAPSR